MRQKSPFLSWLWTHLHFHTVFIIPLWRACPKIVVLSINCTDKGKKCLLKLLHQKESEEKWQAVECSKLDSWSPKPWEMQMTGERGLCQVQPALLWPTELSDGLDLCWTGLCARTPREWGESWAENFEILHPKTHSEIGVYSGLWKAAMWLSSFQTILIVSVTVRNIAQFVSWILNTIYPDVNFIDKNGLGKSNTHLLHWLLHGI